MQSAEIVFFKNHLFLRCLFADNSQARGCIVMLTLSTTNDIERFEVSRENKTLCTTTNNQREAYTDVFISDLEGDGKMGNVNLNVTAYVQNFPSIMQYTELTGCREGMNNYTVQQEILSGENFHLFSPCSQDHGHTLSYKFFIIVLMIT